jgi:hypothetical protein
MSIFLEAFRVGETVELADQVLLDELQMRYSDRLIIVPNMSRFAGRRVRIKYASSTDGYQFHEIEGRWMEEALVDPCLQEKIQSTDPISYATANQTYIARADNEERPGYVSIVDSSNELVLRFRSPNPECDAHIVNRIASIRCRISFEINYGFYPKYKEMQQ